MELNHDLYSVSSCFKFSLTTVLLCSLYWLPVASCIRFDLWYLQTKPKNQPVLPPGPQIYHVSIARVARKACIKTLLCPDNHEDGMNFPWPSKKQRLFDKHLKEHFVYIFLSLCFLFFSFWTQEEWWHSLSLTYRTSMKMRFLKTTKCFHNLCCIRASTESKCNAWLLSMRTKKSLICSHSPFQSALCLCCPLGYFVLMHQKPAQKYHSPNARHEKNTMARSHYSQPIYSVKFPPSARCS